MWTLHQSNREKLGSILIYEIHIAVLQDGATTFPTLKFIIQRAFNPVSLQESNEAYSSNVTWCFEEYSGKISTLQSLQRFSAVTYAICCCDSQVKLVQSLIPVQSCAGAKLASLLVDGKLGWQCVSRAWTQVVAYSTKRTTVLICGRYLRGKETNVRQMLRQCQLA